MSKHSKFEALLRELEASSCPDHDLSKLYKFLETDNVFVPLFESYIIKRLEANVHPERLLNLAYHLERSVDTHHLSERINKKLASKMIKEASNYDQFAFMYKHDARIERHVYTGVVDQLKYASAQDLTQVADKISPFTGIDKHTLILSIMEKEFEMRHLSNLMIMEKLKIEDQYMVLIRALQSDSEIFAKIFDWGSGAFHIFLSDKLNRNGDDDQFLIALRTASIPTSQIQSSHILNGILNGQAHHIPETIDRLYQRAETEGEWEYLLTLGASKNKKVVLRSIVKAKNQKLTDEFFRRYKNCPEVKHLVPFM